MKSVAGLRRRSHLSESCPTQHNHDRVQESVNIPIASHLPRCILSRSCLSWPPQTGCWLHYRMLSKIRYPWCYDPVYVRTFCTYEKWQTAPKIYNWEACTHIMKAPFFYKWMKWHIILHFFGFSLTCAGGVLHGPGSWIYNRVIWKNKQDIYFLV